MDELPVKKQAQSLLKNAWTFFDQGDVSGALQSVDHAIELLPEWSEYWVMKGHILRETKKFDEAESAIRKALQLNETDHLAWIEFGLLFRDQEFFEKAAFCFRQATQITPDFNIYTILANTELTFDPEAAIIDAEKALALRPGWEEAIRIRDAARLELDRTHDANSSSS